MSHKIQITVDDKLNDTIKSRAKQMGLSVSSYARLALMSALPARPKRPLEQAIDDLHTGNIESLTLSEFNQQVDRLS